MEKLEKIYSALHEAENDVIRRLPTGEDVSHLVSISWGNNKMGKVASVSLLPVLSCPARCKGTCGDKCYALKIALLRPVVLKAYARNTAIAQLAPEAFFRAVNKAMASVRFFRFHVSGDFRSAEYFRSAMDACRNNPHCEVLVFTKKYELVNKYLDDGETLPENLHILFSGWTNLRPTEAGYNPHNLPETTVYEKEADINPAWNLCGGNCLDCAQRCAGCWTAQKGETIAFKIH